MKQGPYFPLTELADPGGLPLGDLFDDVLDRIWIASPTYDSATDQGVLGVFIDAPVSIPVPGVPSVELAVSVGAAGIEAEIQAQFTPVAKLGIKLPLVLRVDADVLRPLQPGTDEPDRSKSHLEIELGTIAVSVDLDGNVAFDIGAVTVPRCMVADSGVILEIGKLQWVTPGTPTSNRPSGTPVGFTGLFLDDVKVELPGIPAALQELRLDDAFIGTGGLKGTISAPNLALAWDGNTFTGDIAAELFGFKGGLTSVRVRFEQSALVECAIEAALFVPYLDKVVGLALGIAADAGLTAVARLPRQDLLGSGVAAGTNGNLLSLDVGGFMKIGVASIRFEIPVEGPPVLELTGDVKLTISGFVAPAIGLQGLRIDTSGGVTIEGGWIDLTDAKMAPFHGFPLELTRIGFGSSGTGAAKRQWVGLNGGLKLAEGLPLGASVEGLRIEWNPKAGNILDSLSVTLEGIGLEVSVPGAFEFSGAVSFFTEDVSGVKVHGLRGSGTLGLPTLKMSIDADVVIGRLTSGQTFFYFRLGVELPAGIPLFNTGTAIYGFHGLVANNMAPNKAPSDHWYYGWYLRPTKGATKADKWGVSPGSFALGAGVTIGTVPDDGFSVSAKTLLILVLPGPQLILEGKGSFLRPRPGSSEAAAEGELEALLVLDIPAKLFQLNLTARYAVPNLLEVRGGADVAFSWRIPQPQHIWHLYLGERTPVERRWSASILKVLSGNAYFMLERSGKELNPAFFTSDWPGIELGAWAGIDEEWGFGPVRVWLDAAIDGAASVGIEPTQFEATLRLSGDGGVSAFGAVVELHAAASVIARGPTPWYLHVAIEASIRIDLWLFDFEWSAEIELEWGDPNQPVPQPALPIVVGVGHEHLKADEGGDLAGTTVPQDGAAVVLFRRPVHDIGGVGLPTPAPPPAEPAGNRSFAYRLAQVAIVHKSGGDRVVAAAGVVDIAGGSISVRGGLDLPAAAGGELELVGVGKYPVTGSTPGALSVTGSVPDGSYSYRLRGPRIQASVNVKVAKETSFGTILVTLTASPGAKKVFAGGELLVGSTTWEVAGNDGPDVSVRVRTDKAVPPVGASGTLRAPLGGRLRGSWIGDPMVSSKLMLGVRTPFAWFRRNDVETLRGQVAMHPDYACGPEPVEEPACEGFDAVPLGGLAGPFRGEILDGTAVGDVRCVGGPKDPADRYISIGEQPGGQAGQGEVIFVFDPPVDRVWVHATHREGGWITVTREDGSAEQRAVARVDEDPKLAIVEIAGPAVSVEVSGTLVHLSKVCFVPGWSCFGFEAASFPQRSTGRQSYAGVILQTAGTMDVGAGVLTVTPPAKSVMRRARTETVKAREIEPIVRSLELLTHADGGEVIARYGGVIAPPVAEDPGPATLEVVGLDWDAIGAVPGAGVVYVRPTALPTQRREWLGRPTMPVVRGGRVEGVRDVALTPLPEGFRPETPPPAPGRGPEPPPIPGGVGPIPGVELPQIPRGLGTIPGKELRRELLAQLLEKHRLKPGGFAKVVPGQAGQRETASVVTLTVHLPAPVTRVRVHLVDSATVSLFRGASVVASAVEAGGRQVLLRTDSWADRVVILATGRIRIDRVCTDAGPFAWARFEQWRWNGSIQRSVEQFYLQDDPVLPAGPYRIDVVTGWDDVNDPAATVWTTTTTSFSVGPPPGMGTGGGDRYPGGGPLNQLATYVEDTLPASGWRPFYRAYDVGVRFNERYVSRMFLAATKPLTVAVVDSNGKDRRAGALNVWDESMDIDLTATETEYLLALRGTGATPCATFYPGQVARDEAVLAGAGELLGPDELHRAELRAGGKSLYGFEFVTSRFAGFAHQLGSFDGICRSLSSTHVASWTGDQALTAARSEVTAATADLTAAGAAVAAATDPAVVADALQKRRGARSRVTAAYAALSDAQERAFETLAGAYGLSKGAPLPRNVEVSRLVDSLLIESPEPLHWERLSTVTAARTSAMPLRRREVHFDRRSFGAPDVGTFAYGGLDWMTDAELGVVDGAVERRVAGSLALTVTRPGAIEIAVEVRLATGGEATLSATGTPSSSTKATGPTAAGKTATLTVTGTSITSVTLTGTGVSLVSLTVTEPFVPVPSSGDLRLVGAVLPASATDTGHRVEMMSYRDTKLAGWSIDWYDALNPGTVAHYHTFGANDALADARLARVYGGLSSGSGGPDDFFGGAAPLVSEKGVVFQLVDRSGVVVDEHAVLPVSAYSAVTGLTVVPNGDGTRALVLSSTGALSRGHWLLSFTFERDVVGLPRFSVAGSTTAEQAVLAFTVL